MKKKYEYIPLCLLGATFTIPGDMIRFKYGSGILEELQFINGEWVYHFSKNRKSIVDHSTMDDILIGWYTSFDHSSNGWCTIEVRMFDEDGDSTWVTYKN